MQDAYALCFMQDLDTIDLLAGFREPGIGEVAFVSLGWLWECPADQRQRSLGSGS